MKAAILEYICQKAQETTVNELPCDMRCETRGHDKDDRNQKTRKQGIDPKCDLRCTGIESGKKAQKTQKTKIPEYCEPASRPAYFTTTPPNNINMLTLLETAFINLAYFFMGATVMIILFHTLAFKHFWPINVHIFLITIGSQLFIPIAILLLHPLDGAAIWMKCPDRYKEAFLMLLSGVGCILFGTLLLLFFREYRVITFHSFFGFVSAFLHMVDVFMLLIVRFHGENFLSQYARFLSIPSFLCTTLAFISGIFRKSIMVWYPAPRVQIPVFLMIFCLIYTTIIMYRPIYRFVEFITAQRKY